MLKRWALFVLLGGCSAALPPAAPPPPLVERPAWLADVVRERGALRACLEARAPADVYAVDLVRLEDGRVGVVTVGGGQRAERCVWRGGEIVLRRGDSAGLRASDFARWPHVSVGEAPRVPSATAYSESIEQAGVPVAWVHWPGVAYDKERPR